MTTDEPDRLEPLLRVLRAVRRRLRVQAALDGAARAVAPGAVTLLALAGLARGGFGPRWMGPAAALCVTAFGAVAGAVGRIPLARAAHAADVSHGLADRLRSALELAREPRSAFVDAAIADAVTAARQVVSRRAAPIRRPRARFAGAAAGMAAIAVGLLVVRGPAASEQVGAARRAVPVATGPSAEIDAVLFAPEREAARALAEEAERSGDEEARLIAGGLLDVMRGIERRELSRREVLARLASRTGGERTRAEAMRAAAEAIAAVTPSLPAARGLEAALRRGDVAAARREIEALRREMEKRQVPSWLRKLMQKAAAEAIRKMQARLDAETMRELARQFGAQEAGAGSEQTSSGERQTSLSERQTSLSERQTSSGERQTSSGERQTSLSERQTSSGGRQTSLSERQTSSGGRQTSSGGRQTSSLQAAPGDSHSVERLADALAKEERRQRGERLAAELRELVARQGGQSSTEEKAAAREGAGPEKSGLKAGEAMRAFLERAGGDGSAAGAASSSGDGVGAGETGRAQGAEERRPLPWGDQHDAELLGQEGEAGARGGRRAVEVEAMVGEGPSRAQTIWEASSRGFSSRGYRRAFEDYSAVSDEVMERDGVPPGYRWFVRRYFQLIRPRR